jgi:hypothetical protein
MQTTLGRIVVHAAMAFLALICVLPVGAQDQSSTANSAADQKKLARIAGTVVREGTDEPLRKARVSLVLKDQQGVKDLDAVTAANGTFAFDGLTSGTYELVVRHNGYVPKSYAQDEAVHDWAQLTLVAGQKMEDLIFRLQKCPVITGRIVDEDGDPVADVAVGAELRSSYRGKEGSTTLKEVQTNDLGEYRLFDLLPGRYLVCASPRYVRVLTKSQAGAVNARSGSKEQSTEGYAVTCYPAAVDSAHASVIELKGGDEIPGLDITLLHNRTYKIHGTLTDLSGNSDAADYAVDAMPRNELTGQSRGIQGVFNPKDRSFEIPDLVPGTYELMAYKFNSARPDQAFATVEIIDADLDSVKIVMKPGADLRGRIAMEGNTALPPTVKITLYPHSEERTMWHGARTRADGSFELPNVHDGSFAIVAASDCKECFLKSAKLNGADLLDKGLQIAGAVSQPLELVYSSGGGTVDGSATKDDGLPAVGATVVLVPELAHREFAGRYKQATSDQYGRFTIRGVAPGTYGAFAFKGAGGAVVEDADFIKPFESDGKSIEIDENGKQTVQLKEIVVNAENSVK